MDLSGSYSHGFGSAILQSGRVNKVCKMRGLRFCLTRLLCPVRHNKALFEIL